MNRKYDIPFAMRVDDAFLDAIDELRRAKTPIPSRAEVVRDAVMTAANLLKRKPQRK